MPLMILLAATLGGCGGKDTADTGDAAASGPGSLLLTFAMDGDYIESMDEPPVGSFYGSIFYGDDVDSLGPIDGAEVLEEVTVEGIDLSDGGPTGVLYTTGELPLTEVVILGFLDSDANTDGGPDRGDPVTLPSDNDFDVVPGETTVEVYFGLLNP